MDLSRYAALFAAEARDHVATSTQLLLAWERAPESAPVDELFRAFHTIKGMAASMGYEAVAEQSHALETTLAAVRDDGRAADAALLQSLFDGVRSLGSAIAEATGDGTFATLAVPAAAQTESSDDGGAAVRVARRRLDRLGRLAAELEVATYRLDRHAASVGDHLLEERVAGVRRVAGALQDEVAGARLTPVRELFARLPLAVREAARELGRKARLETEGDQVEVDRAVLEALAEPLIHLVRNAVGHGIEAPKARRAAKKPAEGRILVRAERERGGLVLTVEDDGAGIDRDVVRERAAREGLHDEPDAVLRDDDALLLVLSRPGFSTAASTSRTAGRGVGVDAVLTAVRRLRGTLDVSSELGQGTRWRIRVPVGVAAVRAVLARAGRVTVAVPFYRVKEALRIAADAGQILELRGKKVPIRSLGTLLGQPECVTAATRKPAVVVVGARGDIALMVDELSGQQEVLVEAFAAPRGVPAWVEGAAVLADGGTALVLAPSALT